MNDFRDLKAIAEACQQHQPLRFMPSHGALYIRNDNGIVFDVHQKRSFPDFMAQNKDYADFVLAAKPATVLALIAENELQDRLIVENKTISDSFRAERDHLKAENEALRRQAETAQRGTGQLVAENEALRKSLADIREAIEREYWSEYAGLEETRAILDAATGKGLQS